MVFFFAFATNKCFNVCFVLSRENWRSNSQRGDATTTNLFAKVHGQRSQALIDYLFETFNAALKLLTAHAAVTA